MRSAILDSRVERRARGVVRKDYPRLRVAVALIWFLFVLLSLFSAISGSIVSVLCAIAIGTVALLPAYYWTSGRVPGLPVLPLHLLTLLWTYALPLVVGHPELLNYSDEEIFFSTACVLAYGLVAALAWIFVVARRNAPRRFRVLPKNRGVVFFTAAIFVGGVFISLAAEMIELDPRFYGILRSTLLGFSSVAIFVLSLRMGRGHLTPRQRHMFLVSAAFYVLTQLATLYLVGAIVTMASALIGFTIGRGRVPWAAIAAVTLVFAFLHNGKSEMRGRYWGEDRPAIQVWDLPGFFAEWISLSGQAPGDGSERATNVPIYERVSLMHLLLMVQRNAPAVVPYLGGETYAIIPRLLVPRFMDPDKPYSHQGTTMLNVQFGLQDSEEADSTTIGWGLLNEGYANFGFAGVIGVASVLGLLFGFAGRLTTGAPAMSFANMVGVTFCALAIQVEFTMGVFATVLFQSLVVLAMLFPFLESRRAEDVD